MTTYKQEIVSRVLNSLLDKYPAGTPIGDKEWNVAYKILRVNQQIDTLQWKLDNISIKA